jgi:hypothetical protein
MTTSSSISVNAAEREPNRRLTKTGSGKPIAILRVGSTDPSCQSRFPKRKGRQPRGSRPLSTLTTPLGHMPICATTSASLIIPLATAIGVFTPSEHRCGLNPPVAEAHDALNGFGSHGYELVAGLAGWLALRRRAMDVARLSFLLFRVARALHVR